MGACGRGKEDEEMKRGFVGQSESFARDMSGGIGGSSAKGIFLQEFVCLWGAHMAAMYESVVELTFDVSLVGEDGVL